MLLAFTEASVVGMAILLYLCIMAVRELIDPLHTAWVNQGLDSNIRAPMLSFSSQLDSIGQTTGGPMIGFLAQQVSLQAGMYASALFLFPVFILLGILRKKGLDNLCTALLSAQFFLDNLAGYLIPEDGKIWDTSPDLHIFLIRKPKIAWKK